MASVTPILISEADAALIVELKDKLRPAIRIAKNIGNENRIVDMIISKLI